MARMPGRTRDHHVLMCITRIAYTQHAIHTRIVPQPPRPHGTVAPESRQRFDQSGILIYRLTRMFRYLKVMALVLGAVATIIAPCIPALTLAAPCAMSGCDDDAGSRISSANCCCATPGTPASTGSSTAQAQIPVKLALAHAATAADATTTAATMALAATAEPAVHVPIFLLNTSLLM